MKAPLFNAALLAVSSFSFASCGLVKPEGARLNGRAVAGISREAAASEGIKIDDFKNISPVYLPANRIWYTCFEERGMLLAAGEQFTVFADDSTGRTRLHRGTGMRDALSRQNLDALLVNPVAAIRPTTSAD